MGLVGRLDADTSGIMVFTNDGRLNDRILQPLKDEEGKGEDENIENELDAEILTSEQASAIATAPFPEIVVPVPVSPAPYCAPNEDNLAFQQLKRKEYVLTLLQGRNSYCIEDGVFNVAKFEEEFGLPLVFNRCNTAFAVKEASIKVLRRYQDPNYNRTNRPELGWVIEVLVNIKEGKHKQIRRLAKRAGYITIGLERSSICGGLLRLESVPAVGQCRWLTAEEKYALYKGFQLI
jgi:hypothetical protein